MHHALLTAARKTPADIAQSTNSGRLDQDPAQTRRQAIQETIITRQTVTQELMAFIAAQEGSREINSESKNLTERMARRVRGRYQIASNINRLSAQADINREADFCDDQMLAEDLQAR